MAGTVRRQVCIAVGGRPQTTPPQQHRLCSLTVDDARGVLLCEAGVAISQDLGPCIAGSLILGGASQEPRPRGGTRGSVGSRRQPC